MSASPIRHLQTRISTELYEEYYQICRKEGISMQEDTLKFIQKRVEEGKAEKK
jgi:hypothetical protein